MTGLICLHMFFLLQFHWLIFYDPTFHISAFKPLDLEGSVLLLKNMFIGQLNGGELCFTLPLPLPPHPSSSTHRSCLEQLDSIFTDFKIIAHLTCNRSLIFSLLMCAQLYLILCNPMDYVAHQTPVHGIFQAKLLKWVAISYSRESLPPGIEPTSPASPALAGGFFYHCATWEAKFPIYLWYYGKARAFVCKV